MGTAVSVGFKLLGEAVTATPSTVTYCTVRGEGRRDVISATGQVTAMAAIRGSRWNELLPEPESYTRSHDLDKGRRANACCFYSDPAAGIPAQVHRHSLLA